MVKLLPLGSGDTGVIAPRFLAPADFVSWPHILEVVDSPSSKVRTCSTIQRSRTPGGIVRWTVVF